MFELLTLQTSDLKSLEDLKITYGFVATPLGRALAALSGGCICYLAFAPEGSDCEWLADLALRWPGASLSVQAESVEPILAEAFAPTSATRSPRRLLVRGTPFQVEVWRALLRIPPGQVRSYADVARSIGRPKAVRAVGSAVGANPIAWLIPCHCAIRSDGQLGGYRWGSAMKRACLNYLRDSGSGR
ncbi:MAG: methylated-DNA--[protein]-cysteine S-methyltransferase [Opitutales bacterium]